MKKISKNILSLLLIAFFLTGCNNATDETNNNNDANNNSIVLEKKGHTLSTDIGKFIVDKDGSVYYINQQESSVAGTVEELTNEDLSVLGTKQQYTNYTYQNEPLCDINDGCTIEAYKLDLTNISSVYEVSLGNNVVGPTIILLSYDGKVNELSIDLFKNTNKVTLTKNISKYPNIVSVVPTMSFGGHSAILIDENGNKYNYTEAINN